MADTLHSRIAEDRRLRLLTLLMDAPGYESSQQVLHQTLATSASTVQDDVIRLRELGLVTTRDLAGIMMCKITLRGTDVAKGLAEAAGVARPLPGSA